MRSMTSVFVALMLPTAWASAQAPAAPPVTITLGARHGHVMPSRQGFTHTGGGNIDVAQPAPDTLIITMTGVAVAGAHPCKDSVAGLDFDLEQSVEIAIADPKVKQAKVSLEGRVIGLLRSQKKGSAEQGQACAALGIASAQVLCLCVPPHHVAAGENLSLNCHEGPLEVPIPAGQYTLHQTLALTACHPHCVLPCKAASAEFAPDPALDPLWISYWEPFHGAAKRDFGFQVILKVAPDGGGEKK
ncbi:hypothetical protein AYO40_07000 [Planctomycetaceae bacterium SCGC AG-212-D15]|nr:hypothetical protein AYO40_07000 [Planctomycetaceae bacterium SCGC AG-212-D15]